MYQTLRSKDFNMIAASIAPPSHYMLTSDLRDLSVAHLIVAINKPFKPYIKIIEGISDQQTEFARLQFLHTLKEVENTFKKSYNITDKVSANANISVFINQIILNSIKEVEGFVQTVKENPNNKNKVKMLETSLQFVSEGYQFLNKLDLAQVLKEKYFNVFKEYEGLGSALVTADPLHKFISSEKIKADATKVLEYQLARPGKIDFKEIKAIKSLLGDKELLSSIVQSKHRYYDAVASGEYVPLNVEEAKKTRNLISKILTAFDICQSPGFINTLYRVGVNLDYQENYCTSRYKLTTQEEFEKQEVHKKIIKETLKTNSPYIPPTPEEKSIRIKAIEQDRKENDNCAALFANYRSKLDEKISTVAKHFKIVNDSAYLFKNITNPDMSRTKVKM